MDEGPLFGWSGVKDWAFLSSEREVSAGILTFKWEYSKDVNETGEKRRCLA